MGKINTKNKLVSVIIPTYKRPLKLTRAIESVLNQTYGQIEIIVVDDNSPDTIDRKKTEQVMLQYNDPKLKYVQHAYNKNGSAARNTGFRHSQGAYIMFLDDDDEFLPRKVEMQVACLDSRGSSWGACYTKYKRLKNGKMYMTSTENREGNLYFEMLCRNLFIQAGSNLMVRREVYEALDGFDESFVRNQDIEFAVRLLKICKLAYVDEYGLINHIHLYEGNKEQISESKKVKQVTSYYLLAFKHEIDALDEKERYEFYRMINLQVFRHIAFSRNHFKLSVRMVKRKDVKLNDIVRYYFHLLYRRIYRVSCGFDV